ncbi:MAG TPA: peptidylprolyl isomerase [Armatimonadota bacterium]|jgi:cyclophilin family peptidyl-prolyl cis-trans isomerase
MKHYAVFMGLAVALGALFVLASCKQAAPPAGSAMFPDGTTGTKVATDTGASSATGQADSSATTRSATPAPAPAPEPAAAPEPTSPLTTPSPTPGAKSAKPPTQADVAAAKAAGTRHATIKTSKGDIEVELYGKDAPLSVANFVKLSKAKFYNGLIFHRVEPGFVIQGGDPLGSGMGGPGYNIRREISPKLRHVAGALAWARSSDPNSAGSQFYITLAATPSLDDEYAVFGKVVKGMNVVQKIAKGDAIKSVIIK